MQIDRSIGRHCPHRPPCPALTTRFVCGQRTLTEDAVKRGLITWAAGASLLAKYGVAMTPPSKVYTGSIETAVQGKLHVEAAACHVEHVDQFLKGKR